MTNMSALLDKILDKIPAPLSYLSKIVRGDSPERASAFLAVASGIALIAGFVIITIAMTKYDKKLTTEFLTVCAALVSLSTFNQVDRHTVLPTPSKINKPEDKETLQG
jgi:hypothetical protein